MVSRTLLDFCRPTSAYGATTHVQRLRDECKGLPIGGQWSLMRKALERGSLLDALCILYNNVNSTGARAQRQLCEEILNDPNAQTLLQLDEAVRTVYQAVRLVSAFGRGAASGSTDDGRRVLAPSADAAERAARQATIKRLCGSDAALADAVGDAVHTLDEVAAMAAACEADVPAAQGEDDLGQAWDQARTELERAAGGNVSQTSQANRLVRVAVAVLLSRGDLALALRCIEELAPPAQDAATVEALGDHDATVNDPLVRQIEQRLVVATATTIQSGAIVLHMPAELQTGSHERESLVKTMVSVLDNGVRRGPLVRVGALHPAQPPRALHVGGAVRVHVKPH